jgi:hypothetical protein
MLGKIGCPLFDFRQWPYGSEHSNRLRGDGDDCGRLGMTAAARDGWGRLQATPGNPGRAGEIKKLPTCKPDPVPALLRAVIIYLAPALLQGSSCLPSGAPSLRKASGEPPSDAGIRGISACKVYPRRQLPGGAVGSYPTFSTSPGADRCRDATRQLFSVALSVNVLAHVNALPRSPALNRCIALCCPDFPWR